MSDTCRFAQREQTARCGSLVLSAESRADRPASLRSRHRRGAGKPAALDDHYPLASVIGSVVCRTVDPL